MSRMFPYFFEIDSLLNIAFLRLSKSEIIHWLYAKQNSNSKLGRERSLKATLLFEYVTQQRYTTEYQNHDDNEQRWYRS